MRRDLLAAAACLLLLLAACSGGDSDEPESFAPPPSTEAEEAPSTESGETETETEPEEDEEPEPVDPGRPGPGGPLDLVVEASGLEAPVHGTGAPGEAGRLYIVEQAGRIRVLQNGRLRGRPFLDITSLVKSGGEQGLLSVAFHPEYASNRLFYVNYTDNAGDTRVVEYSAGGAPAETRELLRVEQPYRNHNGGQLAFDRRGLLYVGMGDGGSGGDPENRAQDPSSQLGKLLRLDVDTPGSEWETVGIGLRNPWRFSFDRVTDDLWVGDVGQQRIEEVDFVAAEELGDGHNFGWDVYEGSREFERKALTPVGTLVEPITEYTHRFGCSVTGGYVYRGERLRREAWGRYFYGDYCSGRIWSVARWNGEVTRRGHPFRVPDLTSFAQDLEGELYLLSAGGTIYRLAKAR